MEINKTLKCCQNDDPLVIQEKKQQHVKSKEIKAKIPPRITQQLSCLFIYSSSSLSNKYKVVMILQTQSRSSSEKGYIADTRPRNFDASVSAASPCKTNNNYAQQQCKPYL